MVADLDPERSKVFSAEFGVPSASVADAIADPATQAVAVATPASTHHDVACAAMSAGKDVFVEKPMALVPEDAEAMLAVARSQDRILMVGHLLRYHPAFIRLIDLVSSGDLGRLQYVYSTRLNFGRIRREEDVLWSFAPHDLSMILALAGEEPSEVKTEGRFMLQGEIADVTTTHLDFPSGLSGHVFVSWLHPSKEQKLVVIGEEAMAIFDDLEPVERKLSLYRSRVEWQEGMPVAARVAPEYVPIDPVEPLKNELSHFLDCVVGRRQPVTDGAEGLRVLRVLDEAGRQLQPGRPLRVVPPPADSEPERSVLSGTDARSHPGVHPTAVIDDGAVIGRGTKIWHFSHVMPQTTIGENCSLGQNVVAGPNVSIGDGVKIQNNVSVYEGVTIEDEVFCGPSMVFTNVTTPRAAVNRKDEFAPTLVRRGASIGANATIVCGSTVGRFAMVAAGAVVTKDVADHALVAGVPARQIGWVSRAGEVLDDNLTCPRTGETYELRDGELTMLRPVDVPAVDGVATEVEVEVEVEEPQPLPVDRALGVSGAER